jgi:hypothetical protein
MDLGPFGASAALFLRNGELLGQMTINTNKPSKASFIEDKLYVFHLHMGH